MITNSEKNALVIGGSGFMGSHTADQLTRRGYKVAIFDRKTSEWLQPGQEMIIGELDDRQKIAMAVKNADIVYHFAGISDIGEIGRAHV